MAVFINDLPGLTGGGWTHLSNEGYLNTVDYAGPTGNGSNKARWTFSSLNPGLCSVALTWTTNANRATNTPWTIYDSDGTTVLAAGTINQELAPTDFTDVGVGWKTLAGAINISGNSLYVEINDNANEYVIADAARVDNTGVGFAPSATKLLTSHAGVVLTLTGTGTTWDGSTTFTVSGLAGCSITGQTVIDATHATITLTIGATAGNLTISDGSHPNVVAVVVGANSMAAGNWSNPATWDAYPYPGNGNTANVRNGHSVSVDVDTTVGTSPNDSTTNVLTIDKASLTVAAGKLLRVRGNILVSGNNLGSGNSASLNLSAGAILEFDASQSAGTTATHYVCVLGNSQYTGDTLFTTSGTSGSRCVVRSNPGGGTASFQGGGGSVINSGVYALSYCDCYDLAAPGGWSFYSNFVGGVTISYDHCTFTRCGEIHAVLSSPDAGFSHTNNVHFGSLGYCIFVTGTNLAPTAPRIFTNNAFDKSALMKVDGATIDDNIFLSGPGDVQNTGKAASFARNFVRRDGVSGDAEIWRMGDWVDVYCVCDVSVLRMDGTLGGTYASVADAVNPHWTIPAFGQTGNWLVQRTIFESFGDTGDGDIDYGPNQPGFNTIMTYCIVLPSQTVDGNGPYGAGTMTTNNGWNGEASRYDHCTMYAGTQGMLAMAEGGNGFANMVVSAQSNICWNDVRRVGGGFSKFAYCPTGFAGKVADMVTPTALGHNCVFNLNPAHSATNSKPFYDIPFTDSTSVGVGDVNQDPNFVDPTRNFTTWVASIEPSWGASPTGAFPANASPSRTDYNAHGLYKLALTKLPTHGDYDSRYTLAALQSYIKAGFAPQNAALAGAGHDGITIGAVPMAGAMTAGVSGQMVWNTRSPAGVSRAAVWNQRQAVGKAASAVWNVLSLSGTSTAGKSGSLLWNVRAAVGKSDALAWKVRTTAGKAAAGVWNVRATAGKSAAAVWNLRSLAGVQRSARWNTLSSVPVLSWDHALRFDGTVLKPAQALAAAGIHVGDEFPLIIKVKDTRGVLVDLSSAATKEIWLRSPDTDAGPGQVLVKGGELVTDGTDGLMGCHVAAADITEAGTWRAQSYVELPTGHKHSDVFKFKVRPNLK